MQVKGQGVLDKESTAVILPVPVAMEKPEPQTLIRLDLCYIHTISGLLKILQIACGVICFGIVCADYRGAPGLLFAAVSSVWTSTILFFCYAYHLVESLKTFPWLKLEIVLSCLWTFVYLLTASLVLGGYHSSQGQVASIFGYVAATAFGFDICLKVKKVASHQPAQG